MVNTRLEVKLVETTSVPTLEEIFPYQEALTINEYQVIKVIEGPQPNSETIRIAQWAITNNKVLPDLAQKGDNQTLLITPFSDIPELNSVHQRNDLPINLNEYLYYDLSPLPESYAPPKNIRSEYQSDLSRRLPVYWLIRHQLKLLVIGNSHTAVAVDPQKFYQPENNDVPVSMSLSPAGSEAAFQCLIADQYAATLPKLEWVVWGVSPRIFNKDNAIDRRARMFINSPGYLYDRQHWQELTKQAAPDTPFSFRQIREQIDNTQHPWGWSKKESRTYPVPLDAITREKILERCDTPHFKWNPEAWQQFQQSVKGLSRRNIKVLLFTPPCHPLLAQTHAADGDNTGKQDYEEIVEQLQTFSTNTPGVYFLDISKGGRHEFKHEHFADIDHLHESGAIILTDKLVKFVEKIDPPAP